MAYIPLTERQLTFAQLMAKGQTDRETGIQFGVVASTVKKALQVAMYKTETKNRPHLVTYLFRHGLIDGSVHIPDVEEETTQPDEFKYITINE